MSAENIGKLIDALDYVREKKRDAQAVVNKCIKKENELKLRLIEACNEQGISKATGSSMTASLKRDIVPAATDWGKITPWILRHKRLDLLQKRLSPPVYREILEENPRGIPGIEPHEDVRILLRKTSD